MTFVHCDGDWGYRQPVLLDGTEFHVFPFVVKASRVQSLCDARLAAPSQGRVTGRPWLSLSGDRALAILAFAGFPRIYSEDEEHKAKGYISEHDVGIFVPVRLTVDGADAGTSMLIPYLWVDNHAGVIMGREIFGFPKIFATFGWRPERLEFDVKTQVFATHTADTQSSEEEVLSLTRRPLAAAGDVLDLDLDVKVEALASGVGDVAELTLRTMRRLLAELFEEEALPELSGFDRVPLVLLRQFRDVRPGGADPVCYQEVVGADFELRPGLRVLPLVMPLGRTLSLPDFASVNIAATLGVDADVTLRAGARARVDLRLAGRSLR